MAARQTTRPKAAEQDGRDVPAYFIAIAALYIGAARAHAVGDRVLPDHVAKFGWESKVRHPDAPTPEDPAPTDQPATDEDQASTSKEGA